MTIGISERALVFCQFGKFLTKDPGEPIIDQHVLRGFRIYMELKNGVLNVQEVNKLAAISRVAKKDKELIGQYKDWLRNDLREELRNCEDYVCTMWIRCCLLLGKKLKKGLEFVTISSNSGNLCPLS